MDEGGPGEYDPEQYLDRVARPLRMRPDLLPANLAVRYAMPPMPPVPSADWIAAHLQRIIEDWKSRVEETPQGAVYQSLLDADRALSVDPGVDLHSPSWWAAYDPWAEHSTKPALAVSEPEPVGAAIPSAQAPTPLGPAAAEAEPEPAQLRLSAHRFGDEVELRWSWPTWGTHADVRWRERHVRVTRSEYKERGCWRYAMSRHRLAVDVVVRGRGAQTLADVVVVDDRRQEVRYSVRKRGWPGSRKYELTFSTEQPPVEFCMVDVGWSDADLLPLEKEQLVMIGDAVAIGGSQVHHVVTVPPEAEWLCCVTDAQTVDLVPPDVAQLRVGRRSR